MTPSNVRVLVRDAHLDDRDHIIRFNLELASETESKALDPEVLGRGVDLALADPARLRYWVAELEGRVVGQAAITREWSDWRSGWLWWFQSVFVAPEARGLGVFRALHRHIRDLARAQADVIGLRLYVEHDNQPAQRTYLSLGFQAGGYHVFEELWTDRFGGR